MVTYIIESQGLYKIGKTSNIEYRLSCYRTHNPKFELIHVMEFDCEMFLHKHFSDKQFKLEWFTLTLNDVEWIRSNHDLLSENTYNIIKENQKKQAQIEREAYVLKKREQKRINKENEILRKKLKDKEEEAWLLRKIRENPSMFT